MKKRRKVNSKFFKKIISKIVERLNKLYIAIAIMIIMGIVLLVISFTIVDSDMKNIAVGLGTGVVTSALVTLYIEFINSQIQRKKLKKYKQMLMNPLFNAVRSLYVQAILSVNEYRVRMDISGYLLLPMRDTKDLSEFFNEMKKVDLGSIKDQKEKERLEDFSHVELVYYKEVISQYNGIPFESLILDSIITQDEYDMLKRFTLLNESVKCLNALSDKEVSEQDRYCTRVQLLHCMLLFINRLMIIFDFISIKIKRENEWIKKHLSDVYFNEIYSVSDEYIQQQCERAEAEAEYYAEHPELLEAIEESEEEQLHRKINEAIWAGDAETIRSCFPQIDKNNKQIQSELTWSIAKDVMKDKTLKKMYFEKYGVKYKVRKEKRRKR